MKDLLLGALQTGAMFLLVVGALAGMAFAVIAFCRHLARASASPVGHRHAPRPPRRILRPRRPLRIDWHAEEACFHADHDEYRRTRRLPGTEDHHR